MQKVTKIYHRPLKSQDCPGGRDSTHWAKSGWSSKECAHHSCGVGMCCLGSQQAQDTDCVTSAPSLGHGDADKNPSSSLPESHNSVPTAEGRAPANCWGFFWDFQKVPFLLSQKALQDGHRGPGLPLSRPRTVPLTPGSAGGSRERKESK